MNLRILKKLSKRAAPHMASLGYTCEQCVADYGDSYTSTRGHDRKHMERYRACCPWPGTVMLGWQVGYYEREWEEDDAWSLLKRAVCGHWEEYREIPGTDDGYGLPDVVLVRTRRFSNPSAILRALPEVIEARQQEKERRTAAFRAASKGADA